MGKIYLGTNIESDLWTIALQPIKCNIQNLFLDFIILTIFFYHFQWTYIFWVQIILEGKMQWNRLNLLKMTTDAVSKNWQTQHNILD